MWPIGSFNEPTKERIQTSTPGSRSVSSTLSFSVVSLKSACSTPAKFEKLKDEGGTLNGKENEKMKHESKSLTDEELHSMSIKPYGRSNAITKYCNSSIIPQYGDRFIKPAKPSPLSNTPYKRLSISELSNEQDQQCEPAPCRRVISQSTVFTNDETILSRFHREAFSYSGTSLSVKENEEDNRSARGKPSESSSIIGSSAQENSDPIIPGSRSQSLQLLSPAGSLASLTVPKRHTNQFYNIPAHSSTLDSISVHTHNSFANSMIDILIEQNPALRADLEELRKSITEHESQLREDKLISGKQMQQQINDLLGSLRSKNDTIEQQDELIRRAYGRVDAREASLAAMKNEIRHVEDTRDRWEHDYKMLAREMDYQRQDHHKAMVRLEREKRDFVEQVELYQARFETEKARMNSEEQQKLIATEQCESMRTHFDFYRDYYEQQDALYSAYFSKDVKSPSTTPNSREQRSTSLSTIVEGQAIVLETRDGAVKQATEILRGRYRSMMEGSNGDQPLRGFEFLAWLERDFGEEEVADTADNESDIGVDAEEDETKTPADTRCSF